MTRYIVMVKLANGYWYEYTGTAYKYKEQAEQEAKDATDEGLTNRIEERSADR